MRKRIVCFFLAILMLFALTACDNNDEPNDDSGNPPSSETINPDDGIQTPIVPI